MRQADVVIIGAGAIGLSCGYWIAKSGAKVIVLDKGNAAWEASARATGFHSLRGENPPEVALASQANKLWMTLDDELGYPTEWQPSGRLWVAIDQDDWVKLQAVYRRWQALGLPIRLIDRAEARDVAPCLSERVLGGVHTTRAGHANPQRTCQAFAWALQDRGGQILEHTPVIGIQTSGGKVAAVETPQGNISTRTIINCAGPQVGLIGRMVGVHIPIATARMEALVTTPLPPQFGEALVGNGLSVRQTRRGNLHFNGGPHEWIDVDLTSEPAKPGTPLIRNIARRFTELFPSIADTRLLRSWAGIVDVTPDHACIIDRLSSPDGMIIVTASGHGFGLSPGIGLAISEIVISGRSSVAIDGLGLDRFSSLAPDWLSTRGWVAGAYNT